MKKGLTGERSIHLVRQLPLNGFKGRIVQIMPYAAKDDIVTIRTDPTLVTIPRHLHDEVKLEVQRTVEEKLGWPIEDQGILKGRLFYAVVNLDHKT